MSLPDNKKARKAPAQFLTPKHTPPKLTRVLERPRLFARLDHLRDHSLVWVSGPAGAGKTTLVAGNLAWRKERAAIWYRIDAGDNDPATFFLYLTQAARATRPAFDGPAFTVEYQADLELFARKYFRRFYARLKSSRALVLDNYDEIAPTSPLHEILRVAAEEAPPGVTIFVLSRSEPPASLARLGVSGQMARIGWDDIRLDIDEVRALSELRRTSRRAPLSAEISEQLHRATNGWAAGIVLMLEQLLAGASEAPPAALAGREGVFDYFAGEVLRRAAPEMQHFLLRTALFEKFSAAMAEGLTRQADAAQLLRELVRRNYFTTEHPGPEPLYRYHPLFREFLLTKLRRERPEEEVAALQRRAAALTSQSGNVEDAVQLWADAGAWDEMAAHLIAAAPDLLAQGRVQTLGAWIERIPAERRERNPWLLYWHGSATLPRDPFAGYDLFELAYKYFSDASDVRGCYLAWIGVANGLFFRNDDMSPAREWIEELERLRAQHPQWPAPDIGARVTIAALSILTMGHPQHPALPQWLAQAEQLFQHVPIESVRCIIGAHLGIYYSFWGEIGKLAAMARQLRPLADSPAVGYVMRLFAHAILVLDAWQAGDDDEVVRTIERGLKLIEESGVYITAQWLLGAAMVASHGRNRLELTDQLVERYRKFLQPRRRTGVGYYHYQVGWLALSRKRPDAAKVHFESALDLLTQTHSMFFLAQARAGLLQTYGELGDFARAREQLDAMRRDSAAMKNRLFLDFQCNYLEAYLRDKQGDTAGAVTVLRQSFEAAARNNWIAQSSWQRAIIARLCLLALENDIEPDYVRRLVRVYRLRPPAGSESSEAWPHGIKIYTLGRFELRRDDVPVAAAEGKGHRKPLELLKTLIAFGGRQVSVESVINVLWPDAEGDAAMQSFKITLHRLRKLIGREWAIELAEGRLGLNPAEVWVDAWAFQQRLLAAESADRTATPAAERVLGLYRGHFLDGESDTNAAVLRFREQLRGQALRALRRRLFDHEQASDWPRLAELAEHALNVDEIEEDFHAALMRANLAMGKSAQALAAFERAELIYSALSLKAPPRLANLKAQALAGGSQSPE